MRLRLLSPREQESIEEIVFIRRLRVRRVRVRQHFCEPVLGIFAAMKLEINERATSPTKFANALNYGRSLALLLGDYSTTKPCGLEVVFSQSLDKFRGKKLWQWI